MTILMDDEGLTVLGAHVEVAVYVLGPQVTGPPPPLRVAPAPVDVGVVVPGSDGNPLFVNDPDPPAQPGIMRVYVGGALPAAAWGKACQRAISDPGTGQVTVERTDPTAAADYGDPIDFYLGSRLVQTAIVERREDVRITADEERSELVGLGGRGVVAELDNALVYPDLGAEEPARLGAPVQTERHMNWTSSTWGPTAAWTGAVATNPLYGDEDPRFARPDGWPPAEAAQWIWDRPGTLPWHPTGDVYFRYEFGVSLPGPHMVWAAASDDYELWLDGTQVLSRSGFYTGQAESVQVDLGNHFHQIAVRATNRVGRGGLIFAVLPILSSGLLGTAAGASGPWVRCTGYPTTPPGTTAGRAMRALVAEAAYRHAAAGSPFGWSCGFGDYVDSNGRSWDTVTDLTIPVGLSLLGVLAQLAEAHVDWTFMPGARRLLMFRKDEMGRNTALPPDLTELTVAGER